MFLFLSCLLRIVVVFLESDIGVVQLSRLRFDACALQRVLVWRAGFFQIIVLHFAGTLLRCGHELQIPRSLGGGGVTREFEVGRNTARIMVTTRHDVSLRRIALR